jgi:hypothetical protein
MSRQQLYNCPLDCQQAFDDELAVSGRTVTSPPGRPFSWQQPDTGVQPKGREAR